MGTFLIVLPRLPNAALSRSTFEHALADARQLGRPQPRQIEEIGETRVASYPRLNGTASPIAVDKQSGDWLLTAGTWLLPNVSTEDREASLLRRYHEVGVKQLAQELEGFFVVLIGDSRRGVTYAITDIVGSCHAFWRQLPGAMLLSSSSLLLARQAPSTLDALAWQEFLNLGVVYEDRTLFHEVRKLKPASIHTFENGELANVEEYWRVANLRLESRSGSDAAEALWEGLTRKAKCVTNLFPKLVCDLTGGYDSRALVSAFVGAGFKPDTVVSGPSDSGDVRVSRELARVAGLKHRHMQQKGEWDRETLRQALEITDGEYDLVEYARILAIHSNLSHEFSASCNGSFGEVGRGFWWEVLWPHAGAKRELDAVKVAQARYAAQNFDAALFKGAVRVEMVPHLAEVIRRTIGERADLTNASQMDQVYLWMRMQRWQGRIASSTNQIWPCLSPFLLRSVLEVMLEAQERYRRKSLLIRIMLARFSPTWARIPLEHGYPAQPASIANLHRFMPLGAHYGRKIITKGFRLLGIRPKSSAKQPSEPTVPVQLWAKEELRSLLEMKRVASCGLFDSEVLSKFLAPFRSERAVQNDQWTRLLTLECVLEALERRA